MKTEKEKMQAGETYYAFDPELMKLHRDCLKWVEEYLSLIHISEPTRP